VGFDILQQSRAQNINLTSTNSGSRMLGLQDFYRAVSERGVARDIQFRITQLGDSKFNNEDLIYIRTGSIPSREIQTDSVFFRGFRFNVPMTVNYPGSDGWDIEILMDRDYKIYDKLYEWHKSYFDETTLTGANIPDSSNIIELVSVNDKLDVSNKIILYGCCPVKLGDIKYNIGGTGSVLSISMTISYQYWAPSK